MTKTELESIDQDLYWMNQRIVEIQERLSMILKVIPRTRNRISGCRSRYKKKGIKKCQS